MVGCRGRLEEPGQLLEELLRRAGGGLGLLELEELLSRGEEGRRLGSTEGWKGSTMVGGRSTMEGRGSTVEGRSLVGGLEGGQSGLQGGHLRQHGGLLLVVVGGGTRQGGV